MAAADLFAPAVQTFAGGFSGWMKWLFIGLIVLGVVFGTAYIIKSNRKQKKRWNKQIRVWEEHPITNRILIKPYSVKGTVVNIDGTQMMFLNKPVKGGKLFPMVNYYSEPGVIDLLLTADNRFFLFTGFSGINKQRKELGVSIRYPGIDHQFDRINQKYAKMNNVSGIDRTLELLKKATPIILSIIVLVMFIVGGNYYLDAKKTDQLQTQAEIEVMETLGEASINFREMGDVMYKMWGEMDGQPSPTYSQIIDNGDST